jgi:hypothetical protein
MNLNQCFRHHQPHFHMANVEGEQQIDYSVDLSLRVEG